MRLNNIAQKEVQRFNLKHLKETMTPETFLIIF